ncbi:MAG: tetratricopeptide repeat protein, partial [Methylophilaceae bacterium]|nr:tetratricopeptide repeat protein [Methylophilaceae bacterium]
MKTLQTIFLVLLLSTFSSAYAGDCFKDGDAADCRVKAEKGNAVAQLNLGFMYSSGQGVAQDYKEAVKWYRLAAEQGYVAAQTNLGFMYSSGQGVAQDYKEAVKWYRLAA